jgi:hypothetical protein
MKRVNKEQAADRKPAVSLIAPCALACMLVLVLVQVGTDADSLVSRVGSVFFIERFSTGEYAGALVAKLICGTWLVVAGLILKARKESRSVRMASLVLLPVVSIVAFNGVFDVGPNTPAFEPAAAIAVIGVLLYEMAFKCRWSRVGLALATFAACSAYGLHTALGLWGAFVAAGVMAGVQLVWSGVEMSVLGLTIALRDRKFGYR